MARQDFACLPTQPASAGHLYALQLSSGVIKVGCTRNPRVRMEKLHDEFKRARKPAIQRVVVADIGRAHLFRWEAELIRRVHRVGNRVRGREWYADVSFGAVATMLRQVQRAAVVAERLESAVARLKLRAKRTRRTEAA